MAQTDNCNNSTVSFVMDFIDFNVVMQGLGQVAVTPPYPGMF